MASLRREHHSASAHIQHERSAMSSTSQPGFLTSNPAGEQVRISQKGLSAPSPAVREKQAAHHSEADFMRDLDKVTQRKQPKSS